MSLRLGYGLNAFAGHRLARVRVTTATATAAATTATAAGGVR